MTRSNNAQLAKHLERTGVPGAEPCVDTSAAPFLLPAEIVIDLPRPVSVNRMWRAHKAGTGRVSVSPEYAQWRRHADRVSAETAQLKGLRPIVDKFEAGIVIERVRGDLDNRAKGVLDWLQSRGVIADDKFCERLTMEWGDAVSAPYGCRVTLRAIA